MRYCYFCRKRILNPQYWYYPRLGGKGRAICLTHALKMYLLDIVGFIGVKK